MLSGWAQPKTHDHLICDVHSVRGSPASRDRLEVRPDDARRGPQQDFSRQIPPLTHATRGGGYQTKHSYGGQLEHLACLGKPGPPPS